MSTLAEIVAAVERLSAAERQELLLRLTERMRAEGAQLPLPRRFGSDQINRWIAEDEADLKRARGDQAA